MSMLLIQSLAAVVSFAEAGTGVALSDAVKYSLPFQGRCSHCNLVLRRKDFHNLIGNPSLANAYLWALQ